MNILHIGQNIYYSPTYMHYLRDYHARISLPIFTNFYLVKIQARISLPKRMNLRSELDLQNCKTNSNSFLVKYTMTIEIELDLHNHISHLTMTEH